MSKLEYALNLMANLAVGLPPEHLSNKEAEALEVLVQIGEKAKAVLIEREMDAMFEKREDSHV